MAYGFEQELRLNNKDAVGIAEYFDPDIHFIGPMATLAGKDAVLEAAKRFMSLVKRKSGFVRSYGLTNA